MVALLRRAALVDGGQAEIAGQAGGGRPGIHPRELEGNQRQGQVLGPLDEPAVLGVQAIRELATGKGRIAGALGVFGAATGATTLALTFIGVSIVGIDWRVAFVLIPVACAIAMAIGAVLLPSDTKWTGDDPWDVPGQLLLAFGVISLLYGISHAGVEIASPATVVPVAFGLILLVGFYVWERHMGEPGFFPVAILREPLFLVAVMAGLIYNLSTGALLLSFSNLFQYANGLHGIGLWISQEGSYDGAGHDDGAPAAGRAAGAAEPGSRAAGGPRGGRRARP